jgi:hypothetical protein
MYASIIFYTEYTEKLTLQYIHCLWISPMSIKYAAIWAIDYQEESVLHNLSLPCSHFKHSVSGTHSTSYFFSQNSLRITFYLFSLFFA